MISVEQVRLKPLAEFRSVLEEPGKYLLIPGEEITHKFAKNPVHMNAINLRDAITPTDGASVSETIAANLRTVEEQRKKKGLEHHRRPQPSQFRLGRQGRGHVGGGAEIFRNLQRPSRRQELWRRCPRQHRAACGTSSSHCGSANTSCRSSMAWRPMMPIAITLSASARSIRAAAGSWSSRVSYRGIDRPRQLRRAIIIARPACVEGNWRNGAGVFARHQAEKGVKYMTQFIATMKDAPLVSEPRKAWRRPRLT